MRVVLSGCGGISDLWLAAIRQTPSLTLVGLIDIAEEAARAKAAKHQLDVAIHTDLSRALQDLTPEVVFDCTIPEAHHSVTLTALAHGCHVLGEKPMADTLAQAYEMIEAARRANKVYAVMQNRRFDPNIRAIREVLQSGLIGEITTVTSDFYLAAHFGGFRDTMPHVLIKDMAIHNFDAARFLSGEDPVSVYCHEWNPKGSWYHHGASAHAIFEMTHGVVFSYRGSWCSEGLHTPWESHWRVIGSQGSLTWDGATGLRCEVVGKPEGFIYQHVTPELPTLTQGAMPDWHTRAIQAFTRALETGTMPETNCTDNIKSLQMVFGAIESAQTAQKVLIQ
jgi:predicted dehydrogenase